MFEWFENLSTGMQLVVVGGGLLILFFVVRLNAQNNKRKLQNRREHDFSTRLRKHRKQHQDKEEK